MAALRALFQPIGRTLLAGGLVSLAFAIFQPAAAQDGTVNERALRFSGFITQAASLCFAVPAKQCIENAFAFADRDANRGISPDELTDVDLDVRAWWETARGRLPGQVNLAIGIGLLTAQYAGHSYFVSAWDDDSDGVVSLEELTADLSLDQRPLPLLLQDERAVDWESVRGRLGHYGAVLDRLRGGS